MKLFDASLALVAFKAYKETIPLKDCIELKIVSEKLDLAASN